MVINVTDSNFQEKVLDANVPVIVDFWAEWCGPCRTIAPILEKISEKYGDKVIIAKVDVDNNNETAAKFGVRNIPTLLYVKGGETVDKQVGVTSESALTAKLEKLF